MDVPSPCSPRRGLPAALGLILVLQLAWGSWFLAHTSFEIDGERYFALFDDAMISMAYAKHAVEGEGLVWSPEEEPVEGFTNPLWTGVMAVFHALPLPPLLMALPIQILSLALLLLHTVLVHHAARRFFSRRRPQGALVAAALAAAYVPLAYWSLLGMETALQAVLVTGSVLMALEIVYEGRDRRLVLGILLALGYLTRMDMLVPALGILGWLAVARSPGEAVGASGRLRRIGPPLAVLAAAVLGYQAFRLLYFGDPLPNTYYLKLTGIPLVVRWLQGLATFGDFVLTHAAALALVLGGTIYLLKRRPAFQLPILLFLAGCAYSIYVGGDAWEPAFFPERGGVRANRFLAYLMPQVFLLAGGLVDAGRTWVERREAGPGGVKTYLLIVATGLVFVSANGLLLAPRAEQNRADFALTRPPLMTAEHRAVLEEWRSFQRIVEPGAEVAVFWAGLPAYFNPGYRLVDIAGYTDRETARRPAFLRLDATSFHRYRPGHVKFDYPHLLAHVRPDAFFQTYPLGRDFKVRLLTSAGYETVGGFWVRRDSDRIIRPRGAAGSSPPTG